MQTLYQTGAKSNNSRLRYSNLKNLKFGAYLDFKVGGYHFLRVLCGHIMHSHSKCKQNYTINGGGFAIKRLIFFGGGGGRGR